MMREMAQSPKPEFQYTIADGGKLKTYTLKTLGQETIKTQLGEMTTLMVRRHRSDSERVTTFWCAAELQYLPVKVEHKEPDGQVIIGYVESATGFGVDTPDELRAVSLDAVESAREGLERQ